MAIGQASQDFLGSSGRLRIMYVGHRNTLSALADDGFTQNNPRVVTTHVSTTLTGITKKGVLGSSVAHTRPDQGNNIVAGPLAPAALNTRPLGLFINDAQGNAYENSPGTASGKVAYVHAGGTYGCQVYETLGQAGGTAGNPITYNSGDPIYSSMNGYITNLAVDASEGVNGQNIGNVTLLGTVKAAPSSSLAEVILDLRV